jgi:hypothetical protein
VREVEGGGLIERGDWISIKLTSLICCSISVSTDCSSEEDSSPEALSSSLEADECGDLSLAELGVFGLDVLFATPVELDFRGRALAFVELVDGATEVPTRPYQHEFLTTSGSGRCNDGFNWLT